MKSDRLFVITLNTWHMHLFFFFQAEDGIRDLTVTGVQTCALPIFGASDVRATRNYRGAAQVHFVAESAILDAMQTVNGPGTVNFQNEIVNNWSALWEIGRASCRERV